jgi:hypothetical protein
LRSHWVHALVVLAAVAFGGLARAGTAEWGLPYQLHVDEKGFVVWEALAMEHRGLTEEDWRPRIDTYGPLLLDVVVAMKWWWLGGREHAERVARRYPDGFLYSQLAFGHGSDAAFFAPELFRVLRWLVALLGTLAIGLLEAAAWMLQGPRAGAYAAVLCAACVGLVQVGHFYTAEALLLPEIALFLFACAWIARGGGLAPAALAGAAIAAIVTTKLPGVLVLGALPLAIGADDPFPDAPGRDAELGRIVRRSVRALWSIRFLVAIAVAAALVYWIRPWTFEEIPDDVPGNRRGLTVLAAEFTEHDYTFYDWRFTYRGTTPFLYYVTHVLPYALGAPALAAALFGLARGVVRLRPLDRITLAAAIPTFLFVGAFGVKTIRYVLPALPGLLLAASALLADFAERPRDAPWWRSIVRRVAAPAALAYTVAYGAAWTLMFTEPDPRVRAAHYVAERARPGDVVVVEAEASYTAPLGTNDERVGTEPGLRPPVRVERLWQDRPTGEPAVRAHTEARLRDARFVVLGDFYIRRATHPDAPTKAPNVSAFYARLRSGELGFTRVATFRPEPTLGPIVWDESDAEILCTSFDHMGVEIYERTLPAAPPPLPSLRDL